MNMNAPSVSESNKFTLADLAAIIEAKSKEAADTSYTAQLLSKGAERCAKKFGEEAVELIIASVSNNKQEIVAETADVLYHMLVLLKSTEVDYTDVMAELERRTAQSGLQEKASRQ
jgi:phosphoribosyl-ATP pyrophosphohydrolase